MEFNELIQDRFSCRALSDSEIPHEVLGRIFEAARVAPTAVNKQPFKVWAVENPEARAKLAETTNYTFGASVSLLSVESTKTHGCGNTTDATSPTWMQASSQPTSCSPFTMRDCARRGSDISMLQNSRRHSLRWQTMTSSPSSPSATPQRRVFRRHVTRSESLRWRLSKSYNTKIPRRSGGFLHP